MKTVQNSEKIEYFLYARKSSESEDRQIQSIEDQINRLKKVANQLDLKIIEIYTEAKSACKPDNRPVFDEMMQRIKNGDAQGLLCWQINRLSRNPIDSGQIAWQLQNSILKSIQTIDRQYLPQDNVLLFSVESGVANQFILDLSKNTKRGMQSKLEKGWLPGVPPTGYMNNREDKTIINDPERFNLVKKMWNLMLTGNYTVPQILNIANNEWGFRSKKYKRSGNNPISRSGLYRLFTNPFYAGIIDYGGNQYEGAHEPVITLDEFDRVQMLLGRKGKPRPKKHFFAFTGSIKCKVCGCSYTAETKEKLLKSTKKIEKYTYYHCTRRSIKIKCDQRQSIRKDDLELQIEEELEKYTILPEFLDWALEALDERDTTEVKDEEQIHKMRKKTLAQTQKELEELTRMRYKQLIDDDIFLKEKGSLQTKITQMKRELKNTNNQDAQTLNLTRKTFEFATYARATFLRANKMGRKGLELKKEILLGLGETLLMRDKKLSIEPYDWLIPIKNDYHALEQRYRRLEPDEKVSVSAKTDSLNDVRLDWLRGLDSNQQP